MEVANRSLNTSLVEIFEKPSARIAGRRSLFPQETDESDDELGHMSPLSDDSENENAGNFKSLITRSSENEYVILREPKSDEEITIPGDTLSMFVNPFHPLLENDNRGKDSPSEKLKTPHDTSSCSINLEVHKRKAISPLNSPRAKREKLDTKAPKVRMALFPEIDMALPTSSFYSKSSESSDKVLHLREVKPTLAIKTRKLGIQVHQRSRGRRTKHSQWNMGVRHKIRKPKRKKVKQIDILDATVRILDNSKRNRFFEESKEVEKLLEYSMPQEEKICQIKPLGNVKSEIQSSVKEVKETSDEPDPNRKFFKSSRTKATVTVNNLLKLEIDRGKVSLMQNNEPKCNSVDFSDLSTPQENEPLVDKSCIFDILDLLNEEKENKPKRTELTTAAKAGISFGSGENMLRSKGIEILSPISQMCDTTSGLALNSPKKGKNLTPILENMSSGNSMDTKKLFPVFYTGNCGIKRKEKTPGKVGNAAKKLKPLPSNQTLLDAGQKHFGIHQCPECKLVYHMGDPEEELSHLNYHNAENVLRFWGWKNERIVFTQFDARIIKVEPRDSKIWWKKVKDLLEVVNRELGYFELHLNMENCYVFLYIKNKQIAGCIFTEPKSEAHKKLNVVGQDLCSEKSYPVKCGVFRIWVSPKYRKQGIASSLLDCLRLNFMVGYVLKKEEIALSSPTEMGHQFAKRYFQADEYMIYV